MRSICEKIRRAIPNFPDCKRPWEVLSEMNQSRGISLSKRSVEGLDDADVYAAECVEIQPYCLFSGLVILDEGVRLGPYSLFRGPIYIGRNSSVGPHAEIVRCVVMDNTSLSHKSLVGDSIFGNNINFGGCSTCCNIPVGRNHINVSHEGKIFPFEGKYGSFIEDDSSIGVLTTLMPGAHVSKGSEIIGQCMVSGHGKVRPFWKMPKARVR